MKTITTVFTFLFLLSSLCYSQVRTPFNQELASPTNMFPALTGWHGGLQNTVNYRNQWPGIPATYVFYNIGVDGYAQKLKSGFGLNLAHNRIGTGIVNINKADLNWSPKIRLKNELIIMPSVSVGYFQISIDWAQTTFNDRLSRWLIDESSTGGVINSNVNKLSLGSGLGLVYKDAFLVANVADVTQPSLSFFTNNEHRLARTYSLLLGKNFLANNWTFTPRMSYMRWGEFNTLNIGMNAQYKGFYLGANYVWDDRVGIAGGAEISNRVRFSYGYDFTTSRLGFTHIGSHEFMVRVWLFKDRADNQFLSNLPLI